MTNQEYILLKYKQSIENIGIAYESGLLSNEEFKNAARAKLETCDRYPYKLKVEMKKAFFKWYMKYSNN